MSYSLNNKTENETNKREREDEDDYLSMDLEVLEKDYVKQVNENKKKERDPYYIKRMKDLENQKRKGYNKSAKLLAEEEQKRLEAAPISSSNKGFQLLQKMGFKPGSGIGLGQGGIKEPIKINKNAGLQGLGLETQKREKNAMIYEAAKKIEQKKTENFEEITRQRFRDKQTKKDLDNSRTVCEQLDLSKGILENVLWESFSKASEYKEPLEDLIDHKADVKIILPAEVEKELSIITDYLRRKHLYCLWCGTAYSSYEDLIEQCPGDTSEDH